MTWENVSCNYTPENICQIEIRSQCIKCNWTFLLLSLYLHYPPEHFFLLFSSSHFPPVRLQGGQRWYQSESWSPQQLSASFHCPPSHEYLRDKKRTHEYLRDKREHLSTWEMKEKIWVREGQKRRHENWRDEKEHKYL